MSNALVLGSSAVSFRDYWESVAEFLVKVFKFTFDKIVKFWDWCCENPDQALSLAISLIVASETGNVVTVLNAIKSFL